MANIIQCMHIALNPRDQDVTLNEVDYFNTYRLICLIMLIFVQDISIPSKESGSNYMVIAVGRLQYCIIRRIVYLPRKAV